MKNWTTLVLLALYSYSSADEVLNTDFLEWLGQTAEIEEMGIDVELLIEERTKSVTPSQEHETDKVEE